MTCHTSKSIGLDLLQHLPLMLLDCGGAHAQDERAELARLPAHLSSNGSQCGSRYAYDTTRRDQLRRFAAVWALLD
jgi:hypothetical protein